MGRGGVSGGEEKEGSVGVPDTGLQSSAGTMHAQRCAYWEGRGAALLCCVGKGCQWGLSYPGRTQMHFHSSPGYMFAQLAGMGGLEKA